MKSPGSIKMSITRKLADTFIRQKKVLFNCSSLKTTVRKHNHSADKEDKNSRQPKQVSLKGFNILN